MATHNDIATVQLGAGGPSVAYAATEITVTVIEAQEVGTVGVPIPAPFSLLEVQTPGIQGAKGDQNVYPGPVPPPNPKLNWIWILTP